MTTPTPVREIDELLSHLAAIVNSGFASSDDELARLHWQARKLPRSDPANAHMALGIFASLRLDETTTEQEFLRSLAKGGRRPVWAMNFATMLRTFSPDYS